MKTKKILAALLSSAMVLGTMAVPVFADDVVAKIGSTNYTSLQTALDSASKAGQDVTVEIVADINLNGAKWTPVYLNGYTGAARNIVVQGNNKSISGLTAPLFKGTWSSTSIKIYDLTVKDSTIKAVNCDGAGGNCNAAFLACLSASIGTVLSNCNVSNCTFEDGYFSGGLYGYAAGYSNMNDGPVFSDITITNCSVNGCTFEAGIGAAGSFIGHATGDPRTKVVITGSRATGNTITGTREDKIGKLIGTLGVGKMHIEKQGGVWIEATESNNTGQYEIGRIGSDGGTGYFTAGGSYTVNPLETSDPTTGSITAEEGYSAVQKNGVWTIANVSASESVAQIGTTEYETLAAAIEAASNGATITLIKDADENVTVPTGKTITLDLAGKTLNGKTVSQKAAITNNGTLTISDSVGGGYVKREDTTTDAYYVIDNAGTLTINGGNYTNGSGDPNVHAGASMIRTNENATTNINGGTLSQANFNVLKDEGNCTTNITGGTISCESAQYAILAYGTVNISGTPQITGPIEVRGYDSVVGSANISGGTFNSVFYVKQYTGHHGNTNPSLTISDGTFNNVEFNVGEGVSATFTANSEYGTVAISGGTFSTDPRAYLVSGKSSEKVKDGDNATNYSVINTAELRNDLTAAVIKSADNNVTVKSATVNGEYDQVTAKITSADETKIFTLSVTGGYYHGQSKTVELTGITLTGTGNVICGLIITDIPDDVTVTVE